MDQERAFVPESILNRYCTCGFFILKFLKLKQMFPDSFDCPLCGRTTDVDKWVEEDKLDNE